MRARGVEEGTHPAGTHAAMSRIPTALRVRAVCFEVRKGGVSAIVANISGTRTRTWGRHIVGGHRCSAARRMIELALRDLAYTTLERKLTYSRGRWTWIEIGTVHLLGKEVARIVMKHKVLTMRILWMGRLAVQGGINIHVVLILHNRSIHHTFVKAAFHELAPHILVGHVSLEIKGIG